MTSSIDEVVGRLKRRSEGEHDALDGHLADEVVVWHAYDDVEVAIPGRARSSLAGTELDTLLRAMPDLRRSSTFHVSAGTATIVETARWSGTTAAGQHLTNATCIVYALDGDGQICRMDIYDDSARSRSFAELLVHTLIRQHAGG